MKRTLLLLTFGLSICVQAQTWQQTYGTNGYYANCITRTNDRGYLIGGGTSTAGSLMKIDSVGSVLWAKSYSYTPAGDITDVQVLPDSSIICGGYTNGNSAVLKLTASGNISFARQFSGFGAKVMRSSGGYYLACGQDGAVVRVSTSGSAVWEKFFKYSASELAQVRDIAELTDGNFIGVGSGGQLGESIVLVKFDSNGDTLWTKLHGTTGCNLYSVVALNDGTFLACGMRSSSNETLLIKLDNAGTLIWYRSFGSAQSFKIIDALDGGVYVAGNTTFQGAGGSDLFLMKVDGSGSLNWFKTYGGTGDEYLGDAVLSHDNRNIILVGSTTGFSTNGAAYLVAADTSGQVACNTQSGTLSSFNNNPVFYSGLQISNPSTLTGITINVSSLAVTGSTLCSTVGINEEPTPTESVTLYPNPSSGYFHISVARNSIITVTDLLGQQILSGTSIEGERTIHLDTPNGIYFLLVDDGNTTTTRRIIINR